VRQSLTIIGARLAADYEALLPPLPLVLVELLARLCVAEAMVAFDRNRRMT